MSLSSNGSARKIAFVLPSLTAGGAERVLITLMNRLDRTRFSPEFIVLDETGPMGGWVLGDIPRHGLGNRRVRSALRPLLKTLRRIKPEIVVSTMAHMNFALLLLKPFLPGVKLIVREANVPSSIAGNPAMPPVKRFLARQAYRALYPHADLVISPAQCIIDEFGYYLDMQTDNHALLYNPVDIGRLRETVRLADDISPGRRKIVHFICAGRLHRQKGFDRLIESLAGSGLPLEWRLSILGEGAEEGGLKALVEARGLQRHIHLTGLSRKPWPEIAAADAFLLPSRWEGLPNVVLESLAVGTPVIAHSEAGGIAEISALAGSNSVKVARDMPDFIAAMRTVRPAPATDFRPSLLPEAFHADAVMRRFEGFLS